MVTAYNASLADGTKEMTAAMMGITNCFFLALSIYNLTQYFSLEHGARSRLASGFRALCTPIARTPSPSSSSTKSVPSVFPEDGESERGKDNASKPYSVRVRHVHYEEHGFFAMMWETNRVFIYTWFALLLMFMVPISWMFSTFYYPASTNGNTDVANAWLAVLLLVVLGLVVLWPLTVIFITLTTNRAVTRYENAEEHINQLRENKKNKKKNNGEF